MTPSKRRTILAAADPRDFRLVRAFTPEHNVRRLRVCLDRITRRPTAVRWHRRHRLRERVRALAAGGAA